MRELINVAHAQGMYAGKRISATSNPWKISVQRKRRCVCECICETLRAEDLCDAECCVYYNGVQQYKLNNMTFTAVGYEICIKYIDCNNNKKTISKRGSALFFSPIGSYGGKYSVHISNPHYFKVCRNKIIAEFAVMLCG